MWRRPVDHSDIEKPRSFSGQAAARVSVRVRVGDGGQRATHAGSSGNGRTGYRGMVGDAAEIRPARPASKKTDVMDARLLLRLMAGK